VAAHGAASVVSESRSSVGPTGSAWTQ
jgi:hypothetical protein